MHKNLHNLKVFKIVSFSIVISFLFCIMFRFYKFWCWWKPTPFSLEHKKRDIGKNFRYNKITTNYRKEISLCPLLILSYLFSI